MHSRDTTPESHQAQLEAYRRLGAAGRARVAARMSADTRQLMRDGVRSRHPGYTDQEIECSIRRILYGDELFRRVWPESPLLAP